MSSRSSVIFGAWEYDSFTILGTESWESNEKSFDSTFLAKSSQTYLQTFFYIPAGHNDSRSSPSKISSCFFAYSRITARNYGSLSCKTFFSFIICPSQIFSAIK